MTFDFVVSQKTRRLFVTTAAGFVVALGSYSSFSAAAAPQKAAKVVTGKPFAIGKFRATPVRSGNIELVHVPIDENITVVYLKNNGGGSGGAGSGACLSCKISEISSCATQVCPAIKRADPTASCSDEIKQCIADRCKSKCTGMTGSSFSIFMQ